YGSQDRYWWHRPRQDCSARRVTLIGRSAVPVHRLCAVFRQTLSSAVVYGTEVGLGARVPKVGGLTIGSHGAGLVAKTLVGDTEVVPELMGLGPVDDGFTEPLHGLPIPVLPQGVESPLGFLVAA